MALNLEAIKPIIDQLPEREKNKLAQEYNNRIVFNQEMTSLKSQIIALALFDSMNASMTIDECANFLNCSYQTVRKSIDNKEIKVNYCGARISIPKLQFLDQILSDFLKKKEAKEKEILINYNLNH